jgi:uncharacterized membrane protein
MTDRTRAKKDDYVKLRRYFLAGLLVLAPTVITGWLVWKIFITVDNFIDPIQKKFPILDFPGLGFAVVLVLIFIAGFLATNLFGKMLIKGGDRLMSRVPLVKKIYNASKELSEVFLTDKKTVFKRVVLVRFPLRESYALGFVMGGATNSVGRAVGEEVLGVFVPTTPNPTSGFLLFVPAREATPVDLSVEEALKMVISGGAFAPHSVAPAAHPLAPTPEKRAP